MSKRDLVATRKQKEAHEARTDELLRWGYVLNAKGKLVENTDKLKQHIKEIRRVNRPRRKV